MSVDEITTALGHFGKKMAELSQISHIDTNCEDLINKIQYMMTASIENDNRPPVGTVIQL